MRFSGIVALDGVTLAVEAGQLLAVVGPNGAGKTSLLNCVTGAYRPSAGRILFEGTDTTRAPAHTARSAASRVPFSTTNSSRSSRRLENLLLGRHAALTTI